MADIDAGWVTLLISLFVGFLLLVARVGTRRNDQLDVRATIEPPNAATVKLCEALLSGFPDITCDRSTKELWDYVNTYWASQARVPKPALVIKPGNSEQLSRIVKILAKAFLASSSKEPVQFAVRSGGHSPNAGFASVEAGIVIDLSQFNSIELSDDHKTVAIGTGQNWGSVFRRLEPHGLAVAGGRASSVGVAGLTLGGGLSFYSPQVGFVCDAMVSFEAVLADGSIVTASEASHPDLAIALRGGGNNFGIVTKFTARTFGQKKVWMGKILTKHNLHPAILLDLPTM